MNQRSKRVLTLLLTLLLFASAWQTQIFTAQAFTERKSDPSRKDPHYYSGANPFYAGGYTKECTWYVWGRAYEALGTKPKLSTAAAHHWYQENLRTKACSYGAKPKVGAVMVTLKDKSHGHVAFVEKLYNNGTMLISEYNYNVRGGFSTQVIKQLPAGAKRGRAHKVLGYIYVTDETSADSTESKRSVAEAKKEKTEQTPAAAQTTALSDREAAASANGRNESVSARFPMRLTQRTNDDPVWLDAVFSSESDRWERKQEPDADAVPAFQTITDAYADRQSGGAAAWRSCFDCDLEAAANDAFDFALSSAQALIGSEAAA